MLQEKSFANYPTVVYFAVKQIMFWCWLKGSGVRYVSWVEEGIRDLFLTRVYFLRWFVAFRSNRMFLKRSDIDFGEG